MFKKKLLSFIFICYSLFCTAQSKILAVYEKEIFGDPQGWDYPGSSRPCYLAELDVKTCNLKKILDLDTLIIRNLPLACGLMMQKNQEELIIAHQAINHGGIFSIVNLKSKKVVDTTIIATNSLKYLSGYSAGREDRKIFIARLFSLTKVDLNTKKEVEVWKSNNLLLGLLFFLNGKLYSKIHSLSEIDLAVNGKNTTVMDSIQMLPLANGSGGFDPLYFSMCSAYSSCDTSIVYAIPASKLSLYSVDLKNKTIQHVCSNPLLRYVKAIGNTSSYLEKDCPRLIDLDENNSTISKNDYANNNVCTPSQPVAISDDDLVVNSGSKIDSIVCFISKGNLDGQTEIIFSTQPNTNTNKIALKANKNNSVALINKGWAKSLDFRAALKEIYYKNTNLNFKKGTREISFLMFTTDGITDTAKAYIRLEREYAGKDSIITICQNTPLMLTNYLKGATKQTGEWQPSLYSGTSEFNPNKDKFGKYHYIINGSCNTDTSIFQLYNNINQYSKSIDTTVCYGKSLSINGKIYSNEGQYNDIIKYAKSGCDSLKLAIKLNVLPKSKVELDTILYEGQNLIINNQKINESGDYTLILTNKYGCDSTIDLKVMIKSNNLKKYIPNVFLPEDEEVDNQYFKILPNAPINLIKKLFIINRWGEMIFNVENVKHTDASSFWDGKYKGNKQPSDIYIYYLEVDSDLKIVPFTGEITLLR